jgi:hypothetical protein
MLAAAISPKILAAIPEAAANTPKAAEHTRQAEEHSHQRAEDRSDLESGSCRHFAGKGGLAQVKYDISSILVSRARRWLHGKLQ